MKNKTSFHGRNTWPRRPQSDHRNEIHMKEILTLTSLTHLGFWITSVIDSSDDFDLSYAEVHEAAEAGSLLKHLVQRLGNRVDLHSVTSFEVERVAVIERVLRDAADVMYNRHAKKASIRNSGLCLVMAIILEALQQNFAPLLSVPRSKIKNPPQLSEGCRRMNILTGVNRSKRE
jgi:hypothetical protein